MENKLKLLKKVCAPINMMSSENELKQYFESVYEFFDKNDRFFLVMIKNGGTSHFQEKFKELILNEMRRLPVESDTLYNQEFFTQFRVNAIVGVVEWWIRENHPLTVEAMAENTVLLFMRNR